ncbi:MAG TPA: ethanolamine ammonia-lyase subunit EutC [Polyangiaceae bacterium]|nr:ethanolamine ammonia-lyase subunit EutC [Polyangiaceae bacterium]
MGKLDKRDPWLALSGLTAARIALGRAGGSVRTETLLDFRLAHARAKDAVELPFAADALAVKLQAMGIETFRLETEAGDRRSFLLRPDLGRTLRESSRSELSQQRALWGKRDLCIVVSDGLSALAAERQVAPLLSALLPALLGGGTTLYPVFLAPFARVKLADEIGEALGARHSLMLLGERPGLSSPDSLGAYLTFRPRAACSDADRNCVSNIRPEGLPCADAAHSIAELLAESARLGTSGVALKLQG